MKTGRKTLTILLFLACTLSSAILILSPETTPSSVRTTAQLDSLIVLSLQENGYDNGTYRIFNIPVDSDFSRKTYRLELHPSISKTSLHLNLHQRMLPFGIHTPARVVFPEKDMSIYFTYDGTIFRTLKLTTMDPQSESEPQ